MLGNNLFLLRYEHILVPVGFILAALLLILGWVLKDNNRRRLLLPAPAPAGWGPTEGSALCRASLSGGKCEAQGG